MTEGKSDSDTPQTPISPLPTMAQADPRFQSMVIAWRAERAEREKRARQFLYLFTHFPIKDALCIWTALYPEE